MSSLWTPDGERPVRRDPEPDDTGPGVEPGDEDAELSDEELAAIRSEMAEVRRRIGEQPAADLIANHAMGLYELAAIHLSADPPRLADASLAIDALGFLVDGLGDRLGPNATTLRDALAQIRIAFVQIKGSVG